MYKKFGSCSRINPKNVFLDQIMTEEAFDVIVVGSCMTDLVRWVHFTHVSLVSTSVTMY